MCFKHLLKLQGLHPFFQEHIARCADAVHSDPEQAVPEPLDPGEKGGGGDGGGGGLPRAGLPRQAGLSAQEQIPVWRPGHVSRRPPAVSSSCCGGQQPAGPAQV